MSTHIWGVSDIPDQRDRLAVVTGATGGLGYETALGLAQAGAEVVLAGRNEAKGAEATRRILAAIQDANIRGANIRFEKVDLASLASVAAFAERLLAQARPIDVLVNNAGVMAFRTRRVTADGFEMQFGTNHLGHFALTALLMPLLVDERSSPTANREASRVVTVSSGMHRIGAEIHFDDLQWSRRYSPDRAYSQSKLANLLFALELQRRSEANGWGLMSVAAHPGASKTEIIANGPGKNTTVGRVASGVVRLIGHPPSAGALPTLFAATSAEAKPSGYYGPQGFFEMRGQVGPAIVSDKARDPERARKLWEVSEELTGVNWPAARQRQTGNA
jgi:NAD(P)-dependent dehydrogenase (short-subunit alcohol dehydrogenase family)